MDRERISVPHTIGRPRGGRRTPGIEGARCMLHVTCDLCGKELRPGEEHFVVKVDVFAAHDPSALTEADLDEDHMEAVGELLRQMEGQEDPDALEPTSHHFR